jgi:hypothetical protein
MVALVLGFAGLLIGYKFYPFIQSLRGKNNSSLFIIVMLLIMMTLNVCALLTPQIFISGNFTLFILALVLFLVLTIFGRNIDLYSSILILLMKTISYLVISALVLTVGIMFLIGLSMMIIYYMLYIGGLPFLAIFKRKIYFNTGDTQDVTH